MKKRVLVAACTLATIVMVSDARYGLGLAQAAGGVRAANMAQMAWNENVQEHPQSGNGEETEAHQRHEGKEKSGHHGGGMREVAKLLGISKDELKTALMSGKTLAELAKERGVDRQKVVDLIAARIQKRLDARLKDGDVTREEYDARKARIPELAARIVDEGMPKGKGMHRGGKEQTDKPE